MKLNGGARSKTISNLKVKFKEAPNVKISVKKQIANDSDSIIQPLLAIANRNIVKEMLNHHQRLQYKLGDCTEELGKPIGHKKQLSLKLPVIKAKKEKCFMPVKLVIGPQHSRNISKTQEIGDSKKRLLSLSRMNKASKTLITPILGNHISSTFNIKMGLASPVDKPQVKRVHSNLSNKKMRRSMDIYEIAALKN